MTAKTTYVIPKNGGWAVTREGAAKRNRRVYSTQKEAVNAARDIVQRQSAGQVVILGLNGSIRVRDSHGLPPIQRAPSKSKLGRKAIKKAISTVIRERLLSE
jgi:hypothetical protein